MKNSVAAMRKAHSYPTNQEAEELDDAKEDTSKDSGEIFLVVKHLNIATEKADQNKAEKKPKNSEVTPKTRQNPQKLRSKRDMSANPSAQRNRITNELLKLEKSGALNNLPKV